MASWIRAHFRELKTVALGDVLFFLELLDELDSDVFRSVKRFLRKIVAILVLNLIGDVVKNHITPLQLNRQS